MRLLPALLASLLLLAPTFALAHGELHEAIMAMDRRIVAQPDDATLYLRRGELHRAHEDWAAAAADFDRAAALDASLVVVDLARGALGLGAGQFAEAQVALARFIRHRPDDPAGYAARARVFQRQKRWNAAAENFARAIALAPQPEPELVLERAAVLREAGRLAEAIVALDEGSARLGPLVTFEALALDLEAALGRTDAELRRVERLIAASPRKERWLERRAQILERAGRPAEARVAYQQALAAIAALPEQRRATAATQDLQNQIEAALARVQP